MTGVVKVKRAVVGVDRTLFAPVTVLVAIREHDGEEHEALIMVPHADVNLSVGVIERHGDTQLGAAVVQRMLESRRMRFVKTA